MMPGQEMLKASSSLCVHHRRNLGRGDGQATAGKGASCLRHVTHLICCIHNALQQGQMKSERHVHINDCS